MADELGYERFYCSGGSGGGPHSIACAALIPDRVIAVAAIATPVPVDAQGFDLPAGMSKENLEEFAPASAGARELQEYLERAAQEVKGATADELLGVWSEPATYALPRPSCGRVTATCRSCSAPYGEILDALLEG